MVAIQIDYESITWYYITRHIDVYHLSVFVDMDLFWGV